VARAASIVTSSAAEVSARRRLELGEGNQEEMVQCVVVDRGRRFVEFAIKAETKYVHAECGCV
jgi:hypothetical protein